MEKWIVTFTRIPTAYNRPESIVVEALNEQDAKAIVVDHLRDFGRVHNYVYDTPRKYAPPPTGRIVGPAKGGA